MLVRVLIFSIVAITSYSKLNFAQGPKFRCQAAVALMKEYKNEALRLSEEDLQAAWEAYWANPSDENKAKLTTHYLYLLERPAAKLLAKLPDSVDSEALIQSGVSGIQESIEAFDPSRGAKFQTFSAQRIRGAMLDYLRETDLVPRLTRQREATVKRVIEKFIAAHGHHPTELEIRGELLKTRNDREVDKIMGDYKAFNITSFETPLGSEDGNRIGRLGDNIVGSGGDPLTEMQRASLKEIITKGLSRAERLIIILYYYEGMTMKEIGAALDLSESRVSQMHTSVLLRLRAQLTGREAEFELIGD